MIALAFLLLWTLGAAATWLFVDMVESEHYPDHDWTSGWASVIIFLLWPAIVVVAIALIFVQPPSWQDDYSPPWEMDDRP